MTITLRGLRLPEDFQALADLFNQRDHEPTTAERLAKAEAEWPTDGYLYRAVAVDEQDRILGYTEALHFAFHKPGKFYLRWLVDREHRGLGIGRMLGAAAESYAREHGGTLLQLNVRDDDERSRQIIEAHGYQFERHLFESCLDLATFDDSPYAGLLEAVEATGIRFFTLADQPGEQTERAIYELMNANVGDIPGFDNPTHPAFEIWRTWFITANGASPDRLIVAADGDRLVGATALFDRESGAMYTGHTSVRREYRGRKLALALKLLSIAKARACGAPYMRTHNDSLNGPMLAINWKLGYQKEPGLWSFRKSI